MTLRLASLLGLAAVLLVRAGVTSAGAPADRPLAPAFPSTDPARWIGTPATLESLRGRVVMLDVWTFG